MNGDDRERDVDLPPDCKNWNVTMLGTEVKSSFLWLIKGFSTKNFEIGETLSCNFTLLGQDDVLSKWELLYVPNPEKKDGEYVRFIVKTSDKVNALPSVGYMRADDSVDLVWDSMRKEDSKGKGCTVLVLHAVTFATTLGFGLNIFIHTPCICKSLCCSKI